MAALTTPRPAAGPGVLTVNVGSSSLKLRLLDASGTTLADYSDLDGALRDARARQVPAVAHRVVHGGDLVTGPTVVDDEVIARLSRLIDLAPLHQPKALAALAESREAMPRAAHVVCPDTAFHASMPPEAWTLPLPAQWRDRWRLRRYGFHGLSHAYASRRAAELVPGATRVVCAHLGAGASLAAVLDGASVDTTMGFTPIDGLVMATRPGSVDPGLVVWLMQHGGLSATQVGEALEHRSGVTALAGTGDLAEVLSRNDQQARLAIGVYVHRLRGLIASMVAALGGLDVLVFTGGVGEHAPRIRAEAVGGLEHLGVSLDGSANDSVTAVEDFSDVTGAGSRARVLVVAAREDLELARAAREVMKSIDPPG